MQEDRQLLVSRQGHEHQRNTCLLRLPGECYLKFCQDKSDQVTDEFHISRSYKIKKLQNAQMLASSHPAVSCRDEGMYHISLLYSAHISSRGTNCVIHFQQFFIIALNNLACPCIGFYMSKSQFTSNLL